QECAHSTTRHRANAKLAYAFLPHRVRRIVTGGIANDVVELCRVREHHVQRNGYEPRDHTATEHERGDVHPHDVSDTEQRGPELTAETEHGATDLHRTGGCRRSHTEPGLAEFEDRPGDRCDHDITGRAPLAARLGPL